MILIPICATDLAVFTKMLSEQLGVEDFGRETLPTTQVPPLVQHATFTVLEAVSHARPLGFLADVYGQETFAESFVQ